MTVHNKEIIKFNSYLDKVRDYHRRAQTQVGLESVAKELGGLTLEAEHILLQDDALLEAIAKKVIPKKFVWQMDPMVGSKAQIMLVYIND